MDIKTAVGQITALTRALNDVSNQFAAYAYQHEEERPTQEEIFFELGNNMEALAKLVHRKHSKQFRRILVEMAAYAIYAAARSEEK